MPTPDLMKPSPDIVQVGPGFDLTIGGNYGTPIYNRPTSFGTYIHDSLDNSNVPSTTWDDGNPYYEGNMPTLDEVYAEHGIDNSPVSHIQSDPFNNPFNNTGLEEVKDENNVAEDYSTGASLSEWLRLNPGASYQDAMKYMAQHSDEWAEKLIDYYANLENRDYQASREDNAYQRLVSDMRQAGLNPALMYGGSASPQVGSYGSYDVQGGATSRGISNYSKIKQIMLAYLTYELNKSLGITNSVFKGASTLISALGMFL